MRNWLKRKSVKDKPKYVMAIDFASEYPPIIILEFIKEKNKYKVVK